jgi:hypothetical protein
MIDQIGEKMRSVDPTLLQTIVSKACSDPEMRIMDWDAEVLNNQGVMNTEGLWRFHGTGITDKGEPQDWQVVLKYLTDIKEPDDPHTWWSGRRDALAYESGLLAQLPKSVKSPRCYAVWKHPDAWWIWLEYIHEDTDRYWTITDHTFVADSLGRFYAELLSKPPTTEAPWMCANHLHYWLQTSDAWMDWNHPHVQRYISPTYRVRYEQLQEQRPRLLAALKRLPQVFSHWDMHRRNLRIRRDVEGQLELVAFDWMGAGFNAVGGELSNLVGCNLFLNEIHPKELPELEVVVLEAFLGRLREHQAPVSQDEVLLAYKIWGALWWGGGIPSLINVWSLEHMQGPRKAIFGQDLDDCFRAWTILGEHYLDCADQVYVQLDRLGW